MSKFSFEDDEFFGKIIRFIRFGIIVSFGLFFYQIFKEQFGFWNWLAILISVALSVSSMYFLTIYLPSFSKSKRKELRTLFRIIALLEGVSYILLMSVGLYFKYQLEDPSYVKLLGMPHGILFVSYIVFAFLIKENKNWGMKDLGIVLLASILPFGTFYIDWKYLKN